MRIENKGINIFQGAPLPEDSRLAGWAALTQVLAVKGPVRNPACVSEKHVSGSIREEGAWRVFDRRYWPGETFGDHLSFALRNENLDMLLLKGIFDAVDAKVVEAFVKATPTGIPARRAWFLYELMTGCKLDVPDDPGVPAVDVLDPAAYFTGKPRLSRRHRVRDNLLGSGGFCPIIRRSLRKADLRRRRPKRWDARARIWFPVRQVSCFWPIVLRVLKSRANGLRAIGWSGGAGPFCRRAKTSSLLTRSFGFKGF
jgi:hypothetical protein